MGKGSRRERQRVVPCRCSVCGVRCETVDELADPDHHGPPLGGSDG